MKYITEKNIKEYIKNAEGEVEILLLLEFLDLEKRKAIALEKIAEILKARLK